MDFRLKNSSKVSTKPYLIWGICNLSPESFSNLPEDKNLDFLSKIKKAVLDGAKIIDIGAESTSPKAKALDPKTEQDRLIPALEQVLAYRKKQNLDFLISVDTYKAETAKLALDLGCDIINDISGFNFDSRMLEIILSYKPAYVLGASSDNYASMHKIDESQDIVTKLLTYFQEKIMILSAHNFPLDNLILDPCLGFAKNKAQNLAILSNIHKFIGLNRALLMALSRKRMFEDLFKLPVENRDSITATASALLLQNGVYQHRVHNVLATKQALDLTTKIMRN